MKLATGKFSGNAFLLISKSSLGYRYRNCQQIENNCSKLQKKVLIITVTPQKEALMDKLEEDQN